MSQTKTGKSSFSLRGLFGLSESARLESRVLNLPVLVEKREGVPCENCGFGSMFPAPVGENGRTALRCNRQGCHFICERTVAETPAWRPEYQMQPA